MDGHWRARVAACLWVAMWSGVALAQDAPPADPTERARSLFQEGITLSEQARWEEAAAKFREAMALHDAPAIRYNLASALFESGDLLGAWRLVRSVEDDPETPAELSGHSETLDTQIRDRAAMVTVRVEGDAAGVTVAMDADPLEEPEIGRAIAVPPGTHAFVASRGGEEVAREEVTVARRELREVVLRPAVPEVAPVAPLPEEPSEPAGTSLFEDWRFWAIAGGAVVAIAAVVIIVAASSGTEDPVNGNFEPGVLRW